MLSCVVVLKCYFKKVISTAGRSDEEKLVDAYFYYRPLRLVSGNIFNDVVDMVANLNEQIENYTAIASGMILHTIESVKIQFYQYMAVVGGATSTSYLLSRKVLERKRPRIRKRMF